MFTGTGAPWGSGAPRILIVDDDPSLLVLLADQLRADGYEVITARDGDEALRRLQASWPDLLIIDRAPVAAAAQPAGTPPAGIGSPVSPVSSTAPSRDTANVHSCLLMQPDGQSPQPAWISTS